MRKIAGYLTKNRSGKDQKIAQSTHENGYIKTRKTFWRNSKQFLRLVKQNRLCLTNDVNIEKIFYASSSVLNLFIIFATKSPLHIIK